MDNQQETNLYNYYILVGSSETIREASLKINILRMKS